MKRRILIQRLRKAGFVLVRHGGNHDIYSNGLIDIPIPRHSELNEELAKVILRKSGCK